ncbi:MAG: hypothetical protein ACP5C3_08805 [Methanomicrobiales archaeon]
MSMRNLLLKNSELESNSLLIISEKKGNPNQLTFYNEKGESLLTLDVSVALKPVRTNIKPEKQSIICQIEELEDIIPIFGLPEEKGDKKSNLVIIRENKKTKAVIEFIDDKGHQTNPLIYIHDWRRLSEVT